MRDTKTDLVARKGVISIITTYHQLSAIDRNIKFYNPDKDIDFICSNHHDNYLCESEDEEFDNIEFSEDDI